MARWRSSPLVGQDGHPAPLAGAQKTWPKKSPPEIAQFVDCAHATIDKRLDRAVAQYGLEATHPTVEEKCGITLAYFESLSDSCLDLYREAAAKHSEHVPEELTSER